MRDRTRYLPIQRFWREEGKFVDLQDELALEEILEIYIQDMPYSSTMRLPGDDVNLVRGFCFTDGLINSVKDIQEINYCPNTAGKNRILVYLSRTEAWLQSLQQKDMQEHKSLSSCGLCGRTDLNGLLGGLNAVQYKHWRVSADKLMDLQDFLGSRMELFDRTGCTHASALFSSDLETLGFAEDVGRHNALDKAIGQVLAQDAQDNCLLGLVSSRLSLEMVIKAARMGLQILAGVSAATTLAVDTAQRLNMTLIGFLRPRRMNIYTHAHRLL